MSSAQLEVLKTPTSKGVPGADGGEVEFWIYGGGGAGYLSKRPSDGPYPRKTANLFSKFKVSPGIVVEEKETDLYERLRRVTWD